MRQPDWPARLEEFLAGRRAQPFEYGRHDCCRFSAAAVEAMTGENPMTAFHYSNEIGAAKLIRAAGSLEALVTATLGEPLPAVLMAGRGDVAMADLDEGPTVGVCVGRKVAFAARDGGVTFRPLEAARVAWRVQ